MGASLTAHELEDAEPGEIDLHYPGIDASREARRYLGSLGKADVLARPARAPGDEKAVPNYEREVLRSVISDHD